MSVESVTIPTVPIVHKDNIEANNAPIAKAPPTVEKGGPFPQGRAQRLTPDVSLRRIQAVLEKYDDREKKLPDIARSQPKADELRNLVGEAGQAVKQAEANKAKADKTDDVGEGLRAKLLHKRTSEQAREDRAKAEAELKAANTASQEIKQSIPTAEVYDREYFKRESDPVRLAFIKDANRKAAENGPLTSPSQEMSDALRKMDERAAEIKGRELTYFDQKAIFDKKGLPTLSKDKVIPSKMFQAIMARSEKDWNFSREKTENLLVDMAASYGVAISLADEMRLPVEEKLMGEAMALGYNISEALSKGVGSEFYRKKTGRLMSSPTWYLTGCSQLEDFFRTRNIPQGEIRIPYVLAYSTGVMGYGKVLYPVIDMADWLTDVIPVSKIISARQEGKWVEQTQPARERGLGSCEMPGEEKTSEVRYKGGSYDKSTVEVMTKAAQIVDRVRQQLSTYNSPSTYGQESGISQITSQQLNLQVFTPSGVR